MQTDSKERMTFEYHFRFHKLYQDYYSFNSLGWEYWQYPQKYSIDNNNSLDRQFVFQYTVSGEGAIAIDSHIYTLKPGQAFLVERPSTTHYFLPKSSPHWELKFISFNVVSHNILKDIMNEYGNIVTLPENSSVMQYWEKLYKLSLDNDMDNFFIASAHAYTFMMYLGDTLRKSLGTHRSNNGVHTCLDIIHANYQKPLKLEQLSDICNISPSHLSKTFKDNFKMTPIQYLIRYRIKAACSLLLRNNMQIEDIALQTGFSNANYFSRMFKRIIGLSPKDYRKAAHTEVINSKEAQQLIVLYEMQK